jgi:histone H3/H4
VFCSVDCWDAHVPVERHRSESTAAIEKRAPRSAEVDRPESEKKRVIVSDASKSLGNDEVLVVASKVKKYIFEQSQMSTSAGVYDALTVRIKRLCDRAIEEAKRQGRKTVMDRDLP